MDNQNDRPPGVIAGHEKLVIIAFFGDRVAMGGSDITRTAWVMDVIDSVAQEIAKTPPPPQQTQEPKPSVPDADIADLTQSDFAILIDRDPDDETLLNWSCIGLRRHETDFVVGSLQTLYGQMWTEHRA